MEVEEAIKILQRRIDKYKYQLSDKGWNELVRLGVIKPTREAKIDFIGYAANEIIAYDMAIKALQRELGGVKNKE